MPEYVSAKELAGKLGVSTRTIQRLARQRKIPHLRVGGQYLFDAEKVEKLATVPAQKQLRPYRSRKVYSGEGDREIAQRLTDKLVSSMLGEGEVPAESTLSTQEGIKAYYSKRISLASHADESRLLKLALGRKLDELEYRKKQEARKKDGGQLSTLFENPNIRRD